MVCKNCGKENKNTNIRCEACSAELIDTNDYFNQENIVSGTNTTLKPQEVEISTKKIGCFSVIFGLLLNGIWILISLGEKIVTTNNKLKFKYVDETKKIEVNQYEIYLFCSIIICR